RESGVHSEDWQPVHLNDPRAVVATSNMPPFPWLFAGSAAQPTQDALDLLAYIQSLGRPRQLAGYDSPPQPSRAPNIQPGTDPALIEHGRRVFGEHCASRHGRSGEGVGCGAAAAAVAPRPTNFHEERPTRARALQVLKEGIPGTAMPPWEVQLSDAQRETVVAYLDSLYEAPRQ